MAPEIGKQPLIVPSLLSTPSFEFFFNKGPYSGKCPYRVSTLIPISAPPD